MPPRWCVHFVCSELSSHRAERSTEFVEQLTPFVRCVLLIDHYVRCEIEDPRRFQLEVVNTSAEAPSVESVLVGSEPSDDSDDSWVGRSPYTSISHGRMF